MQNYIKTFLVIFFGISFAAFGQKDCNLDRYVMPDHVKLDSNNVVIYYGSGDTGFMAIKKGEPNDTVRLVFYKKILDFYSLSNLDTTAVLIGAPDSKTVGRKTTYYSLADDAYIDSPKNTYLLTEADFIVTGSKTSVVKLKVFSGNLYINFTIDYKSEQPLKTYKTWEEKFNHSKMICIRSEGIDN